jgi:hypothetical protein
MRILKLNLHASLEKIDSRREHMSRRMAMLLVVFLFATKLLPVLGQAKPGTGFVAIPGEKGGQDMYGPYEVVPDWPKPLSQLPGHEKWTWGTVAGVFAESPNRIFILQQGELPAMTRPKAYPIGPSLSFPIIGLPFRRAGGTKPRDQMGLDRRWEHCLLVLDANGRIIEAWTQWDKLFKHPHAIYINPYDPEKNVWVVDDLREVIFKFSNDGRKLLQTIGTINMQGKDDKHFDGPTFLAWLPDGIMYLADGYNNSRVVKFDKNGKYLLSWGQLGNPPNDTRPGYMNTVHGIAVDPVTRRVYVNDQVNRRIQVFDENGKPLDQWSVGPIPSEPNYLYMSADRYLWVPDHPSGRLLKYDLQGHFLYGWGSFGYAPGMMWGVHQISVDQEGNLYVAEVSNGRAQKFRPRKGAISDFFVGQPVRAAWK